MGSDMTSLALNDVQHAIIDLMPELRRFARSLTGSADAGNDLVQTAYERAFSRPETLIAVEQPASWMRSVIRNIWIDEKRSARDRVSVLLEEGEHLAVDNTERALVARSTLARVRDEVSALPKDQHDAIMLICVEGLSYQQTAAELGVPIGTVMSRLSRARIELIRRINHLQ
jgi:RNA polymerase sigma-70 factor (ECF subfamily)